MQPDERPTLSTPAPQVYMPSSHTAPHTMSPKNKKYVTDRQPTPSPMPPSNTPPRRRGRIFVVLLILLLLASTGTFGYLWYKQRQIASTPASPSPTPTSSPQTVSDNMQITQVFSQSQDAKQKKNLISTISVPTSYRVQSEISPRQIDAGTGGRALWSLHIADGYQEKPTGVKVGSITAMELHDWLKADDIADSSGKITYSIFGGPHKANQKQTLLTNLEVLLAAKDTDINKYLPSNTNKVLFPFTTNAGTGNWVKPDLISRDGWTGYTAIGQILQNTGYRPHMYAVMLTKVKDVTGADRKVLVFADIALQDSLALKAANDQASVAKEIETATAAIEKDGKYGDEATAMYKKLQDILTTLKLEVQ